MIEIGRDFWGPSWPTPHSGSVTWSHLPRTMSKQLLRIFRYEDSTTSLGNLFACSFTLTGEKCCFMFRRMLLCFSLCLLPPAMPVDTTGKSLARLSLHPLFRHLYILMRLLLSLLLSRLNSPSSLSLPSYGTWSSPYIILVALLWAVSSSSILCWGCQNWMCCSRGSLASTEKRGRIMSLDVWLKLLLMQPRLPGSPGAFPLSCFPAVRPLAYIGVWSCSSSGVGLCTAFCWTSWSSWQTISPACWGVSAWGHHNPLVCQPLLPVLCHQETSWGYTLLHHPDY